MRRSSETTPSAQAGNHNIHFCVLETNCPGIVMQYFMAIKDMLQPVTELLLAQSVTECFRWRLDA